MRKHYDKAFRAKVALEALKETSTLQELSKKYEVHPNMISVWKRQAMENISVLFERPNKKSDEQKDAERERDMLLKTVGELKVENDWLKKKYRQVYGKEYGS
jgi:transposase